MGFHKIPCNTTLIIKLTYKKTVGKYLGRKTENKRNFSSQVITVNSVTTVSSK